MKPTLLLICCFFLCCSLPAQSIDVTAYSQNAALHDTVTVALSAQQQLTASYPSVSETYQIPSYDLYDQYWDVNHLRSRVLDIPFTDDRLMLILVQTDNNPFEVPCVFDEITLRYGTTKKGSFHPGVDLKVEPQTLVKSCFDGVVRMAKYYGDYGLVVVVRHYNGLETVYAHLDKLCVKPGQIVRSGDVIGQTGQSGNANDYMLHFEVRFMNEYFNPELMIDFDHETLVKNTLVLMSSDLFVTELDEVGEPTTTPRSTVSQPKPTVTPTTPSTEPLVNEPANSTEADPTINLQQAFDGEEEYHVVQKGETLYRIAVNHNTTTTELMQLNNIKNPEKIIVGQRLRVR